MSPNNLLYIIGVSCVGLLMSIAIASAWIGFAVEQPCADATRDYGLPDCTTALVRRAHDTSVSFRERNDAIWALGQHGDETALPALKQLRKADKTYRGYDTEVSQYELDKAIALLEGGFNLTHMVRGQW